MATLPLPHFKMDELIRKEMIDYKLCIIFFFFAKMTHFEADERQIVEMTDVLGIYILVR